MQGVSCPELKKAREAKALPSKVQRSKDLPFTFVNIGDNLSQAANGGFNVEAPGNWTAIKIFIGDGEQEAEVFLNIKPVIRKGQFSIKDPEYGDLVLAQLAKVLSGLETQAEVVAHRWRNTPI